jgi:glycerophosphoryl diester phosphodiesterase
MIGLMGICILAHRGYWLKPAEHNSLVAFERAFRHGYGAEIDVRDLDGELVVSHDPPRRGALALGAVVEALQASDSTGMLGVNVKADGLQAALAGVLIDLDATRWFAFDMSVPDAVEYLRRGLPTFTRHSDVEREPVLYEAASGVWLDDFGGGWLGEEHVAAHLGRGKSVVVVSPELHGRDHLTAWQQWRRWDAWGKPGLWLCTDHPHDAEEMFG